MNLPQDADPTSEPLTVYPVERSTCLQFGSDAPELVHHAVILSRREQSVPLPCAACGRSVTPAAGLYTCTFCRRSFCQSCLAADGYAPENDRFMTADLTRRDFLIREIKEQAFNVQGGECGQCRRPMAGIAEAAIMRGPAGPLLLCDYPCASQALGLDQTPPPGLYSPESIRIVADPRHGEPQDWLNVHYEISLPRESEEVWAQADCRFAAEIYADPERWEFIAECIECSSHPPRPHKWHQAYFFLRPKDSAGNRSDFINAQDLMDRLGRPERYPLPGVAVRQGDPDCLDYYGIPDPD